MSAIKKGDEPKVIGLIATIVLVFGFAMWRVSSTQGPSPTPSPVVNVVAGTTPSPVNTKPVSAGSASDKEIEIPAQISVGAVDPFRAVVAKIAPPAPAPAPAPAPVRSVMPPPMVGNLAPLPVTANLPPPAPPAEPLKLNGLMPGSDPVAVLALGTKSFVLKRGESFGDGYTLVAIGKDSATVRHGSKTLEISLAK